MNPGSCSLLTLFQEQTFYQTFNSCRDDDFFLLPFNFLLHLYNCGPAAVPQMVVSWVVEIGSCKVDSQQANGFVSAESHNDNMVKCSMIRFY